MSVSNFRLIYENENQIKPVVSEQGRDQCVNENCCCKEKTSYRAGGPCLIEGKQKLTVRPI